MTEDELVGWHHRLNGHEFEQTRKQCHSQDKETWCAAVHGVANYGCDQTTVVVSQRGVSFCYTAK